MAVEIDPLTGKPRKQTVNFPYPQPGQALPMVPTAVQQNVQQQAPQPAAQTPPSQPQTTTQGAASVFDPNLSKQVVQKAQQTALQGASQGTAQLVSGQTQNLLKDPSMGVDYQAQRNLAMDQLVRKQASDFENLRQATGGTANLGFNIQELMSAQMQQRGEKTDLNRQMEIDEQNRRQSDMIKALAQGKETVGMEQSLQTSDINNMITAAGGALNFAELAAKGEILLSEQQFKETQAQLDRDLQTAMQGTDINAQKDILQKKLDFEAQQAKLGQEFTASQNELNRLLQTNLANLDAQTQKEMVNLKAMVDKDMLMTEQDFAKTENEINRQYQLAMQNNDFAQANKMAIMLNEFDVLKQEKQNEFTAAQNLAQNAFQEGLILKEQDFNKAMKYLDFEQEKALMDKDLDKQKVLMDKASELELHQMTQNFNHNEKLAILQSELEEAKAKNDIGRQEQLLKFQHGLELQKIEKEQGFDKSMAYLNSELQKSIANNDFKNTKVLNKMQYEQQMQMHLDQVSIEKAKIDLAQQGIDMAKVESEYAKIQGLIAQGNLDPSAGAAYLTEAFKGSLPAGFTDKYKADPLATQKALQQDFLNQQYQYALAQGVDPTTGQPASGKFDPKTGAFLGLTDEALSGFNTYMQNTIYGQTGTPLQADVIALKSGEIPFDQIKDTADPRYQYLLSDTSVPKFDSGAYFSQGETGRGSDSRTTYLELENAKFVNINGQIWAVDGMTIQDRAGDDWSKYKLVNVATGAVKEITASEDTNPNIAGWGLV